VVHQFAVAAVGLAVGVWRKRLTLIESTLVKFGLESHFPEEIRTVLVPNQILIAFFAELTV
jgi:hypothetical protein